MDQKESKDADHIKRSLKEAFAHLEDLYSSRKINYRVMTGVNALDRNNFGDVAARVNLRNYFGRLGTLHLHITTDYPHYSR